MFTDLIKKFLGNKCATAVVLAVVALIILFPKSTKVAKSVDISDFVENPKYAVQELRTWGQGSVSMPDSPVKMDNYSVYKYKLDGDVLEEYMAMLQDNGFTLVGEHHQSSFTGSYQSYGFICDKAKKADTLKLMYEDVQCHVSIWKDGTKWRVDVSDGIELCDTGIRRDGTKVSVEPKGESADKALIRKSKDKYLTKDKRLKAKIGKADVIADGKKSTVDAEWDRAGKKVTVTAQYSDAVKAEVTFHEEETEVGRIYNLCGTDELPVTVKLYNGDDDIGISQKGAAHFNKVTVRLMYTGEKGDAVVYLYAEPMDTENYPQSIEMLCAVNTTPEKSSEGGGGGIFTSGREPFRPDHSKLDCLTCDGTGDCDECGGAIYVYVGGTRTRCNDCRGTGDCLTCGGSGKR